jgi:hypothetical protein
MQLSSWAEVGASGPVIAVFFDNFHGTGTGLAEYQSSRVNDDSSDQRTTASKHSFLPEGLLVTPLFFA